MNGRSLGTTIAIGASVLVLTVVLIAGAAAAGISSLLLGGDSSPSESTTATIPTAMLTLYIDAAATCPGLPWTVLAAIGTIESSNGTATAAGVQSGANYAGAEGPMQFEPATFAEYDEPIPAGGADPPSPYDEVDAVYAAARDLCSNGALDGADLDNAIYAYNHSDDYVVAVVNLAHYLASA